MGCKTRIGVGLVAVLTLSAAIAADDPVSQRRQIMLRNGRIESGANNLILGKYSAEKAVAAMKTLEDNMTVFPTLFPAGSNEGDEKTSPAIWTDREGFEAAAAKIVADAKAAEAAAGNGQDAFALAWQAVAPNCNACHLKFAR